MTLSLVAIRENLPQYLQTLSIDIRDTIDSTNTALLVDELNDYTQPRILLAEQQTAGRGQFDRRWHSPAGKNIYLSCRVDFNPSSALLQSLSVRAGQAILNTLKNINSEWPLTLKWPNDVLLDNKKLAGVLVETRIQSSKNTVVVVGVGINVNMQSEDATIEQPWTSLAQFTGKTWDRNTLIAQLIPSLLDIFNL